LAYLSALDANLLVLDEPTNHLDLWARESLERALRKFNGTVIFVSHDRYFVNQVADHLLVVEPGRFRVIEGNYDTYRHLIQQGLAKEATTVVEMAAPEPNGGRSKQKRVKPARRKRRFPYRKVRDLETDISACEASIQQLHDDLSSPEVLRDGDKVKQAKASLEKEERKLSHLYEHWEEASELNNE
jgi:ATP-binding cassette subfamily F protein 3